MTLFDPRHLTRLSLLGVLLLALPQAAADPPPVPPGDGGRLQNYEIKAAPHQVAMLPLGEGDRTGQHLTVSVSAGTLEVTRYHAACGRVILSGDTSERVPTFAPTPLSVDPVNARVCGEAGCTCANASPGMIHVTRSPAFLIGADVVEVPVLPGGDLPQPVAEDAVPGCFGWLELVVDTTGQRVGTQLLVTVSSYAPGAPLDGAPTHSERLVAAIVTP